VCPYYLDGDLTQHDPMLAVMRGPVIPVEPASKRQAPVSAAAYRWRLMWLLCSFQGPWRGISRRPGSRSSSTPYAACTRERRRTPVSQNSTACWGRFAAGAGAAPEVVQERSPLSRWPHSGPSQPGSVDMLGPVRLTPTRLAPIRDTGRHVGREGLLVRGTQDRGTARCSLERR
jgi:hypothetical protein